VPEIMHTAKILAHGKIPFSGSVCRFLINWLIEILSYSSSDESMFTGAFLLQEPCAAPLRPYSSLDEPMFTGAFLL